MNTQILTHELLKTIIHYDPDTGTFTRINSPRSFRNGAIKLASSTRGYIAIYLLDKKYTAHRLAWFYINGAWPKQQLDHINRQKTDNRICNLRECNDSQNRKNIGLNKVNKSGFKGVSIDKFNSNWKARIFIEGKEIWLGRHKTAELASQAYEAYAKQHHSEFYYKAVA